MDQITSLKKPELTLGIINSLISVITIGYFHNRVRKNERTTSSLSGDLTKTNDNLLELENSIEKNTREIESLKRLMREATKEIRFLQDIVIQQQDFIDRINEKKLDEFKIEDQNEELRDKDEIENNEELINQIEKELKLNQRLTPSKTNKKDEKQDLHQTRQEGIS